MISHSCPTCGKPCNCDMQGDHPELGPSCTHGCYQLSVMTYDKALTLASEVKEISLTINRESESMHLHRIEHPPDELPNNRMMTPAAAGKQETDARASGSPKTVGERQTRRRLPFSPLKNEALRRLHSLFLFLGGGGVE